MFKQTMVLLLVSVMLLGCRPADYKLVRGPQNVGDSKPKVIEQTLEKVNNCGDGGDTIYKTPSQVVGASEAVIWELGVNASAELPARFLADLEAGFEVLYGQQYMTSAQTGTGWQLAARPGEKIEYALEWSEVWQPGNIVVGVGSQTRTVGYRYRKAIQSEIVNKTLLDCETDQPVAGEAALSVETPFPPAEEASVEPALPAIPPILPTEDASDESASAEPQATPLYQVIVTGVGFPNQRLTNSGQRRASAILAAETDGKRKLAEWRDGATLEAVTVVTDGVVDIDVIRYEVNSYIQGVKTISQHFDESTEQATIEMTLILRGNEP